MNNDLKAGVWEKRAGHSLYGKTIGIIGVGDIGLAVARRAMGFGMDILVNDIRQRPDAANTVHGAERLAQAKRYRDYSHAAHCIDCQPDWCQRAEDDARGRDSC